jgi:DNA-directed RNA polymerase specialized sigma24 family protein
LNDSQRALAARHMTDALRIGRWLRRRGFGLCDLDANDSAALFALTKAAALYDVTRGVPFRFYVAVTIRRQLARERHLWGRAPLVQADECFDPPDLREINPADACARADRVATLLGVLAALPPKQREAVSEHYLRDAPLGVVARYLAVTKQAVAGRIDSALTNLRRALTC